GTLQADLYSLGKLLYEVSTGQDRRDFPALPARSGEIAVDDALLELNAVILKACHRDPRQRYQTTEQMHDELSLLQRGQSVRYRRTVERSWANFTRFGMAAGLITLMTVGALHFLQRVGQKPVGGTGGFGGAPEPEMKGTKNREAWNAYMTGLHYYNRDNREASKRALEYLKEAIRLDPNFARPYAALSDIYRWNDDLFPSSKEAMTKVKEATLQALALDDSLAQAHKELAYV